MGADLLVPRAWYLVVAAERADSAAGQDGHDGVCLGKAHAHARIFQLIRYRYEVSICIYFLMITLLSFKSLKQDLQDVKILAYTIK